MFFLSLFPRNWRFPAVLLEPDRELFSDDQDELESEFFSEYFSSRACLSCMKEVELLFPGIDDFRIKLGNAAYLL